MLFFVKDCCFFLININTELKKKEIFFSFKAEGMFFFVQIKETKQEIKRRLFFLNVGLLVVKRKDTKIPGILVCF